MCHYVAKAESKRCHNLHNIDLGVNISLHCWKQKLAIVGVAGVVLCAPSANFFSSFLAYVEPIGVFWLLGRKNLQCSPYSGLRAMACQSAISSTFKNISQANARAPRVLPKVEVAVVCMAWIAVASASFIMSLAWVILCGGVVCTSVLSTLFTVWCILS